MKNRVFIIMTVLLYLSCFVVTCSETDDYAEVKVNIVSTYTENRSIPYDPDYTIWAVIQYTIENTGDKIINGWEVFFTVHIDGGPQLKTGESVYYILEPGEISSERLLGVRIPEYYQISSKARSASLKHIETW